MSWSRMIGDFRRAYVHAEVDLSMVPLPRVSVFWEGNSWSVQLAIRTSMSDAVAAVEIGGSDRLLIWLVGTRS